MLPSSGSISFQDITQELGFPLGTPLDLNLRKIALGKKNKIKNYT
jgi:hypothetical protein